MLRVFIQRIVGQEVIPLLYPSLGRPENPQRMAFLNNAFDTFDEPFVELTEDPAKADAILIPHNFPRIRKNTAYLNTIVELAKKHSKRILIFWHGDSDARVDLPNTTVLRTSQYRYNMQQNEILMPPYAPDLLAGRSLELRTKGEVPVIGFCGWAQYKNMKNRVGTLARNAVVRTAGLLYPKINARVKGITLRKRAVSILKNSSDVMTNFILRSSYSGSPHTIKIDPQKGREEYVQNLLNSDLALVVKGDGNYSYRFYEALSLGRVPVLIDTDCVLPLEDTIRYGDFVFRVDYKDLSILPQKIRAFWDGLSSEQFEAMQHKARETFEQHLSTKSFLRIATGELLAALRNHENS